MSLNNLKPAKGSNKTSGKRVGRGQGSGKGKTSGRGHNGAQSRSGYSRKIGFEGGQMPLQRRIPKFGFKNINRIDYNTINIDDIQTLVDDKKIKKDLNIEKMIELRLVKKGKLVKVLGRGKLDVPVNITANKFSATAEKLIEKAGGKVTKI
ncbi:MAG: 50S ribosomal protein L15 [Flavobacteriales bacterium]|jgi:large subunit ribosomal protein L15|nr:50S ribosomal protein L15 [Flavobacteriales bacterium]MBL6876807.1 50S ribosomal protein L15 [Flavobacteriales bacterium]